MIRGTSITLGSDRNSFKYFFNEPGLGFCGVPRFVNNNIPNYNIFEYPHMLRYKQSQNQSFYYFKDIMINNEHITEDDWVIPSNTSDVPNVSVSIISTD